MILWLISLSMSPLGLVTSKFFKLYLLKDYFRVCCSLCDRARTVCGFTVLGSFPHIASFQILNRQWLPQGLSSPRPSKPSPAAGPGYARRFCPAGWVGVVACDSRPAHGHVTKPPLALVLMCRAWPHCTISNSLLMSLPAVPVALQCAVMR